MEKKKNDIRGIELLAPAKDLACGMAAVNHGADAVYIGAAKFGARSAAGNSLADIETLARYARRFRVKVYVALNTILFDQELNEARQIACDVYRAGADALIIQDMGLLEMDLPPIPLIASTQTHNASVEKLRFLEAVGFQRAILARELSLREIRRIREKTSLELEFFVHGALCVSYSGQCYLSRSMTGRSANRGECAQPCRLPYSLADHTGKIIANEKYLLSLKDLNLSAYLRDLIDAGITSFKIEGRLKDIAYTKNVTAFYRQRIDEILEHDRTLGTTSIGTVHHSFRADPSKTFNRGFTEYFLRRRSKNSVSMHTPKSVGAYLGRIERTGKGYFQLDTEEVLRAGDGICFFDTREILCGTNIERVEGRTIFPSNCEGLENGTALYRNYDHAFAKKLAAGKTKRLIPVRMRFGECTDGFELEVVDEEGVGVRVMTKSEKVPAQRASAGDTARVQLTKLGDTIYECREIELAWERPYFLPVSVLNALRRGAVVRLDIERERVSARADKRIVPNTVPYPCTTLDYTANISNAKAEAFYRRHGVTQIEPAFELREEGQRRMLMTTKHCLRHQFGMCTGSKNERGEPLFLSNGKAKYRLEFDCIECRMKVVREGIGKRM